MPVAREPAQLPATMRAARYHGPADSLSLDTVPVPEPGPGEALVRVLAAGVCHTELQFLQGTLNLGVAPLTLGHEIAGEVAALSEGVDSLSLGQRVAVYYYAPCDECEWCRAGQEQLCPNMGPQVGFTGDGGFGDYVRVRAANLLPLPDHLPLDAAATLGCAAATALHAVRAVAEVKPGESVVVYGTGAVGVALVQLARLAGARVIAVGRSPAKLALARELGAEVLVDGNGPVVAEVQRATRREGADVVFELVGSAETMGNSVAMLRRRGRLVFVGYGETPLRVNPLHLVLKELQIRAALGCTRAELRETIELAAAGQLRAVVTQHRPLADVNAALDAVRRSEVIGRVVLVPGGLEDRVVGGLHSGSRHEAAAMVAPPSRPSADSLGVNPRAEVAKPPPGAETADPAHSARPSPEGASSIQPGGSAPGYPSSPAVIRDTTTVLGPLPATRPLEPELIAFISRGVAVPRDEAAFGELARRLFAYQFERIGAYGAFCRRRGVTPATVRDWREIPAVPIAAFKETRLACEPIEGAREFNSSGTTRPEQKSRHFHPSLAVYDLNAALNFEAHVLPDGARPPTLILFPPEAELPNSSLAHWLELMARRFSPDGGRWFVGPAGLDAAALTAALREAEASGEPVCLLAASFALVHFLDHCAERGLRYRLTPGSRLMDTGGYKGQSREIPKEELYGQVSDALGLPEDHIVNMYGMTEHSTQFLDAVLRDRVRGTSRGRYKTVPPWARTLVVDPDTLRPLPAGELGLLCHYDLANRASVMAVLSEDLGYETAGGFELVGRIKGSEARGCSIALDELLMAARG